MFMTKPETKLRDSKIFPMRIQPLLCRGEILSLGFYDLDTLSLRKKITVTKIGGQDEGFGFSPDGRFFYNIESPTCFVRTQLSVNLVYMKQENSPKSARYFQKTNE